MANLNQLLDPAASQFRSWEVPEPIVHWGYPLMMAIVIFVMGSFSSVICLTGFGRNQPVLCTIHAYLGSPALHLLFFHAVQGLKLGLAI